MARVIIIGGYAKFLINFRGELLRRMVAAGHEVIACAPEKDAGVEAALREMSVAYYPVPVERAGLSPVGDIAFLYSIFKKCKELKPDIAIFYNIKPVIYGSMAARLAGIASYSSIITGLGYGFIGTGIKGRIVGQIVHLLYRIALQGNFKVFFQNPDDRDLFIGFGVVKDRNKAILVNGSGVDTDYFQPCEFPRKLSFLLIARLLKDKGVREYIEAARVIKKRYSDITFKLVGWIDVNPAAISQSELDGWIKDGIVEYYGRVEDVRPAINDSSVYVLPSYREGTPKTVLEAMSMGRPIITTDAAGCRETVVDGENGFLVRPQDVESLVAAIERFIRDPSLVEQMGGQSRDMAINKYDVHKVNKVIMDELSL